MLSVAQEVEGARFILPDWALFNTTLNPTNDAYYMTGPSGVFNISVCSGNVPVRELERKMVGVAPVRVLDVVNLTRLCDLWCVQLLITLPHFLHASEDVTGSIEYVDGPGDPVKHETFIDIQLRGGFPLQIHERLQVRAELSVEAARAP